MTSNEILDALAGRGSNCLFSSLKVIAVPNVLLSSGYEADLLVLQPSGYLHEVEIKVSVSDFRKEFTKKGKKHKVYLGGVTNEVARPPVSRFSFALPKEVFEKVEPEIPEAYGAIIFDPERRDYWKRLQPNVIRRPKLLPRSEKASAEYRIKLLLTAHSRYWDYRFYRLDETIKAKELQDRILKGGSV